MLNLFEEIYAAIAELNTHLEDVEDRLDKYEQYSRHNIQWVSSVPEEPEWVQWWKNIVNRQWPLEFGPSHVLLKVLTGYTHWVSLNNVEIPDRYWSNLPLITADKESTRNEKTLQWRHNGCDSVSNHQPHDCLLNRLFRRRSKKTSKLRVTGLVCGEFTGDQWIPRTNGQ